VQNLPRMIAPTLELLKYIDRHGMSAAEEQEVKKEIAKLEAL
jgi:hypothetical protein